MAVDMDFIGDETSNLLTKYSPMLIGMGAGAGAVTAIRTTISDQTDNGISQMTNFGVDIGLFLGAAWAADEFTRGMQGKFTTGLVLAGSLSLVNDVMSVATGGEGLMSYMESLFAGTTTVNA